MAEQKNRGNEKTTDREPRTVGKAEPGKHGDLREELLALNRCAKVVKGGRRFSFSALMAVGDSEGHIGLGFGKANEVPEAISKATEHAKKALKPVPLMGRTIPHEIYGEFLTARVMLKPAAPGTGLIANATVRKVLELAGVHDILAKSLGSDNVMNVAKATLAGLCQLRRPDQVARLRGKKMEELIGARAAAAYTETMKKYFGDMSIEEKPVEAEAVPEAAPVEGEEIVQPEEQQ